MESESQKAFEGWFKSEDGPFCCGCRQDAEITWQASRDHIRAKLQSGEMVKRVRRSVSYIIAPKKTTVYYSTEHEAQAIAKAAIAAVLEGI